MPSAGIKEVAALAQVSVGTVSNVLNRPDSVLPATRERVERAIAALGFVRNESARTLRAGRSRTVGLLVLDIANPFFTDVALGAEDVVHENNAVMTLYNSAEDRGREATHLKHLEEQRAQGVLVTPVDLTGRSLDALAARGTPVVLVDRQADGHTRCSVSVDDVLGGRMAMTHLLEQGHQRIAFVGGPLTLPQVADRYRGAVLALGEHDADAAVRMLETSSLSVSAGRDAGQVLAATFATRRPTAIICANDLLALGILQAMTAAELRVPDDVAIVGYDDIDYAAAAAVPLSSIRQPRRMLGRAAAELLFEEINDGDAHEHRQVLFHPELVVRRSSDFRRRRTPRSRAARTTTAV